MRERDISLPRIDQLEVSNVNSATEDALHLQSLMSYWGMLSDLCFSDLLLCSASWTEDETSELSVDEGDEDREPPMQVLGQVRPSTTQTLLIEDRVGRPLHSWEQTLAQKAWSTGKVVDMEMETGARSEPVRVQCIPVRRKENVVAVILRFAALSVARRPGELEKTYVALFGHFVMMIVQGTFPFSSQDWAVEDAPRVGDGVMVLDSGKRISFASPNAVTALHRMGVRMNAVGLTLGELGLEDTAAVETFVTSMPAVQELESELGTVVLLRFLPLLTGQQTEGALVLLRDVTELRRRDRMLLSKDATIREIHHRVKNNLQTISSLLRLQARRLGQGEGKLALGEAERRIRSMAVVHDLLARDVGDQVSFDAIVQALVTMAQESVMPPQQVVFSLQGDGGLVPAILATPLAVVVSELLQNAVEHAFAGMLQGDIAVELMQGDTHLEISVTDNGRGMPEDFSIESSPSLGLTIVRDLVEGQLSGHLRLRSDQGLHAQVSIPFVAASFQS